MPPMPYRTPRREKLFSWIPFFLSTREMQFFPQCSQEFKRTARRSSKSHRARGVAQTLTPYSFRCARKTFANNIPQRANSLHVISGKRNFTNPMRKNASRWQASCRIHVFLTLSPPSLSPLPASSADALISKCFARLDAVQG